MPIFHIHVGMSMQQALAAARATGCAVEVHHGTGEVTVRVPGFPRPMQLNRRRKDTPRVLVSVLRRHVDRVSRED